MDPLGRQHRGCTGCHALGNKATREIPDALGDFDSHFAAWDPTVNANGPVYGAPENSTDDMPVVDPNTHVAGVVPLQVRDADTPNSADTPPRMPSRRLDHRVRDGGRSVRQVGGLVVVVT